MAQIKSQIEEEAEGCFTSMIDIVFLLLIFFILQPFKQPDYRMLAYLPKDDGSVTYQEKELTPTINIRVGGSKDKVAYTIDDEPVNGSYLAAKLLSVSGGDIDTPVTITAASGIYFKYVMKVLDECSIVGMTKVSFSSGS